MICWMGKRWGHRKSHKKDDRPILYIAARKCGHSGYLTASYRLLLKSGSIIQALTMNRYLSPQPTPETPHGPVASANLL